jgi:hypothetical protein
VSYALRNSLFTAALLLLVIGAGIYWVGVRKVEHLKALQATYAEARAELETANSVLAIHDSTQAELDALKERWRTQDQIVPASDSPDQTLAYLDELQKLAGRRLDFDFLFKVREDDEQYSTNIYGIQGKGRFASLYAFLWYLEHGHSFYTVDRLQLTFREPDSGVQSGDWLWIQFRMVVRAYFQPESRVEDLPPLGDEPVRESLALDSFRPLITRTLPRNTDGLLVIEGAVLKGLTHDTAYMGDGEGGLHVLRKGDRIYLGWLDKIDILRNRAEFLMNRGGIWERLWLSVELSETQR